MFSLQCFMLRRWFPGGRGRVVHSANHHYCGRQAGVLHMDQQRMKVACPLTKALFHVWEKNVKLMNNIQFIKQTVEKQAGLIWITELQ